MVFLAPRLVAQISFQEWTADRKLRQPVFLGLRDDKRPQRRALIGVLVMKRTKIAESCVKLAITVSHPDMASSFQARGSKSFIWNAEVRGQERTIVVTVIGDEREATEN